MNYSILLPMNESDIEALKAEALQCKQSIRKHIANILEEHIKGIKGDTKRKQLIEVLRSSHAG